MSSIPHRPRRGSSTPADEASALQARRHGMVLSTRTAAQAAQGALLDRLLELQTREAFPTALDAEPRTDLAPAGDGGDDARDDAARDHPGPPLPAAARPDIASAASALPVGESESVARSRVDRAVRVYVRALMREGMPREVVLEAVQDAVREGAAALPPDALEELGRTTARSALLAFVRR